MFLVSDAEPPLQLYQVEHESLTCFCARPAEALEAYIHYYWWLSVPEGNTTLDVIPDNATDLVMSPQLENFSILYLPSAERFSIPLSGPITYVGISLKTELAHQFFKTSTTQLTECHAGTDTTDTLGIQELVKQTQSIKEPEDLVPIFDPAVMQHLNRESSTVSITTKLDVNKVLAAMQASVGLNGMETIADHFQLSDRQFRRVMGSLFGYGPKKVQRVMRLQASLKEILTADPKIMEDGYYDEAHRIKEIRALTGLTPGQIKRMAEIYNSMS